MIAVIILPNLNAPEASMFSLDFLAIFPCTYFLICWIFQGAAHVPHFSCNNARNFSERCFNTPETTGTKGCFLIPVCVSSHAHLFPLCLEPEALLDCLCSPSSLTPLYLRVKKQYFYYETIVPLKKRSDAGWSLW